MKSSRWFAQLLVLAATVAVMGAMALTAGAGSANAASAPAGAARPETAVVMTTSTAGPTLSSATVHCKTNTLKGNVVSEPGGWPILAWFQQTTYWCYNGNIVTSHKTTYRAGVTASGTLAGLSYTGIVAGTEGWHCYVAAGSHRNCSGNTEYAEGGFQSCVPHVNCESSYVYLQSWENYKGQYFHN
jgi:hypothetical protein